ncbi:AraC family transcriptional regulator [Paenibacillus pseudetheri]|uniref:HTH-type transcriptional activator RhaR n=1 Tax=Paenibacillus pseudetheri TaxID=2897682 RepID=A0ABM9B7K9_9BACL|nr:AraC family transcriptional regulator [Paenibacillus pseudetheri]CAH1054576.1 HTH-type transcriptional activator RhaR [Paenibacillus pseudetheri]
MGSYDISSDYELDDTTNRFLDNFPVHCHFRDGMIGQSKMHAHRGYELYFCIEGHGKLLVADRMYSLLPGSIAIIKPYVLHWPSVVGTKPLHRVVLSLDERYVQTSFDNSPGISNCVSTLLAEQQPYWCFSVVKMDKIRELLLQLAREIAEQPAFYEAALHHLLAELFIILAREQYCPPDRGNSENAAFHLAERILRYLTAHYADSIEVSRLHERFNVSRSHMYDQFKQATGHSLNRYLTIYRINQAKRLLMDTPLSVTEIASAVGFGDLSHFFHTFKSETGLTPSSFRKQAGN